MKTKLFTFYNFCLQILACQITQTRKESIIFFDNKLLIYSIKFTLERKRHKYLREYCPPAIERGNIK